MLELPFAVFLKVVNPKTLPSYGVIFRQAGTHAHPVLFDQTAQAGCLSKPRETSIDSTGVVTSRWPFTLISIRKPSYIPRNLQMEPPSVAPCRFAGVNSGKNEPPRTRISPLRPSMIVIS